MARRIPVREVLRPRSSNLSVGRGRGRGRERYSSALQAGLKGDIHVSGWRY